MKALKYRHVEPGNKRPNGYHNARSESGGANSNFFLAASLATTLGCLGVNVASAQSDQGVVVNNETCQALNDSTALDQESIKTRIACYSRDVEHLNQLVNQLMSERDQLVGNAASQTASLDNYKQELVKRQDAMQRLEERAQALQQELDAVTTDRNQAREQLFNLLAEGKDQPVEVEANKRLFENFSQSYVRMTNEIEELRKQLREFESTNTELSDQQLAAQSENQQLLSDNNALNEKIATLEASVAGLTVEKEQLQSNLTTVNNEVESIKSQLLANADIAQQRLSVIADLKSALAESEKQRLELESTIAALNEKHLKEVVALNNESDSLSAQIDTLSDAQLSLQNKAKQESEDLQATISARDEQIAELTAAKDELHLELKALNDQQLALQEQAKNESDQLQSTIAARDEQISQLTAAKDQLSSQYDTLNEQQLALQEQAKNESDQLQSTIAARDEQISQLTAAKDELSSEFSTLNDQQLTLQEEAKKVADDLQATIAARDEQISQLTESKNELATKLDTLNEQQLAMQEQTKQDSEKLQASLDANAEQIATLTSEKSDLNSERENLVAQITSLEEAHLEETQGYKEEAGKLQDQIASLTTDKTDLSVQLQNQMSANEKLQADAKSSTDKNAELNLAAEQLRNKLTAADSQVSELQANINELGQQSATDKAKFSDQMAALNDSIEKSQQERDTLAAELDTVKPQLQSAEENLQTSQQQNEELVASVDALEQKLAQAAQEQDDLRSTLLETESKSMQATENLAALKSNAETLTSLLAMSRAHSENADATLSELRSEMTEADGRLQAKQTELEALLAEKNRIESDLQAMVNKTKSQADAIANSLVDAGHDTVKVAVGDDNSIEILLGSGQLFSTGSSRLSDEGRQILGDLSNSLDLANDRRIMISGHSDNVPLGPKLAELYKDNWGLSMARALSTANYLADEAGIAAERMTVSGFGATQPIADNDTPDGKQQNRRVEISLIAATETVASAQ